MIFVVVGFLGLTGVWVFLVHWYRKPLVPDYQQKRVFITGTDTGIGRQLALELDSKGLTVYAGCLTEQGGKSLQSEASDRMCIILIDVTKPESIAKAKETVQKDLPPGQGLWGLVNNAGIVQSMLFGFSSIDDYRKVMEVNFFGVVNVTDAFAPLLKKSHGRIVNIISVFGRISAFAEPYACSKFALEPYTDGLRRWMRMYDIHVAAIEPGFIPTKLTSESFVEEDLEKCWSKIPTQLKLEYGTGFFKQVKKDFANFQNFNLGFQNTVSLVTNAITHALLAKHPKDRYIVGFDAFTYICGFVFFPDWLYDLSIRIVLPFYSSSKRTIHCEEQLANGYTLHKGSNPLLG